MPSFFYESNSRLRDKALEHYEDLLGAYFWAYLALFYWGGF